MSRECSAACTRWAQPGPWGREVPPAGDAGGAALARWSRALKPRSRHLTQEAARLLGCGASAVVYMFAIESSVTLHTGIRFSVCRTLRWAGMRCLDR
jgi:hypothetical protein